MKAWRCYASIVFLAGHVAHAAQSDSVANNAELSRIYKDDQGDRQVDPNQIQWTNVGPRDANRREQVRKILDNGGAKTSEDFLHAAMVFQHGTTVEHFRAAHKLALRAAELDSKNMRARWLVAASKDRELMDLGKPQLYGTQFRKPNGGAWELYEVDSSVTDGERAKWAVPPLAEARKRAAEMNTAKQK